MHGRSSNHTARRTSAIVVDPTAADRARIAHWLADAAFDVSRAADFEEGRRLVDAVAPALVVTAARLGPYNGFHLVIAGRTTVPRLAAVVMTHAEDSAVRAEAARLGVGYLVKPVTREALLEMVG